MARPPSAIRRLGSPLARLIVGAALAAMAGCVNPNFIGVQDYGYIQGRVIDAKTNQPIAGAYVNVGSLYTYHTLSDGSFTLQVPVGTQVVDANAPGYYAAQSGQISVLKGQYSDAGLIALTPTTGPGPTPTPSSSPGH